MDLEKYQGKWYEIYKQNADFESFCDMSTAEYKLLPNGSLKVKNKCYSKSGLGESLSDYYFEYKYLTEVNGIASPTSIYNILDLKFDFNPNKSSKYIIFYTDYNYSIVGNLDNNYLSVLSKFPPNLSSQYLDLLLQKAKSYGFKILQ